MNKTQPFKPLAALVVFVLQLFAVPAFAADVTTATFSFTNSAGTTNGQSFRIFYGGDAAGYNYVWTNASTVGFHFVKAAGSAAASATNLYRQLTNDYPGRLRLTLTNATNVIIQTYSGTALGITNSAGWATLTLQTNSPSTNSVFDIGTVRAAEAIYLRGTNLADLLNGGSGTFYDGEGKVSVDVLGRRLVAHNGGGAETTMFEWGSSGDEVIRLFGGNIILYNSGFNVEMQDTFLQVGAIGGVLGEQTLNPGVRTIIGNWNVVSGTLTFQPTTPAQITADKNNYNPGGSGYYLRLSSDASRNITGLAFTTAQTDGQTHLIVNVGSQPVVLVHESASSTAANRFHNTTGANITLSADQEATVWYDATTARWRVSKKN